ncbi:hypothetical protein SLS63_009838 [Diaporthe eres]|uniref:Major facilitator superfamily (MFS) profile domain-containing protein n=1 Tax=Diaporthe eres TaxID=83184 RepID=A0ABR1NYN7_DIAER
MSRFCALSAAMCNSYYGFDASVFNAVQGSDAWLNWMGNPGPNLVGGINTAYSVCAIISGWFIAAPTADFLGRKTAMGIGSILIMISAILETCTPKGQIACFIVGRAVNGIGQGIALSAGPSYIGEITPAKIRGIVMTFWQVAYRCVKNNKLEKARSSLHATRFSSEEAEEELQTIIQAVEFEKNSKETSSGYAALWKDKSVRKRLLLALGMNAGQQLTGQGSLTTYSTKIYQGVFDDSSTIALINALNATLSILFCLNVTWVVERWGRKVLFIVGGAATVGSQTPTGADGAKSYPVGVAIVFLLFLFIFFYKPSWGAVTWIWSSEIFSLNVRAQGVGMAGQTQNIANAIVQQFFPLFLEDCGFYAFYMFAGINCLLVCYVIFLIPETKGVPLEEMDKLFGGASHVQGGAMMREDTDVTNTEHHRPTSKGTTDHSGRHVEGSATPEEK